MNDEIVTYKELIERYKRTLQLMKEYLPRDYKQIKEIANILGKEQIKEFLCALKKWCETNQEAGFDYRVAKNTNIKIGSLPLSLKHYEINALCCDMIDIEIALKNKSITYSISPIPNEYEEIGMDDFKEYDFFTKSIDYDNREKELTYNLVRLPNKSFAIECVDLKGNIKVKEIDKNILKVKETLILSDSNDEEITNNNSNDNTPIM